MNHRIIAAGLALAAAQVSHAAAPSEEERVRQAVIAFEVAHDMTDGPRLRTLLAPGARIIENGKVLMTGDDKVASMIVDDQHRLNPGLPDGKYGLMRHLLTNIEVTLHGSDSASATAYCLVTGYDKAAKQPGIISVGQYSEELVKRQGNWQINTLNINVEQGNEAMAKAIGLGPYNPMFNH